MSETISKNRPRVLLILTLAVGGFVAGQVLAVIFDAVAVGLTHFPGGLNALSSTSSPPWWANAVGLLGLWIGFAAAIVLSTRLGGLGPWTGVWRVSSSDVGYLALGVACQFVIDIAYAPFNLKNLNKPATHLFVTAHGPEFLLLALMTAVGAPVMEEWLFRGVLFRSFAASFERFGRRGLVAAVLASAALFGLAHAEWIQLPGLVALGVVLAVVVHRTGRLVPSIATHAGFNAVTLLALAAQRVHS